MKDFGHPLTYFTNQTKAELDDIIEDMVGTIPNDDIVKLFIEKFDANALYETHEIAITDKLEWAIKHTLQYDIDTEMLILHIRDKIREVIASRHEEDNTYG